MANVNSISGKSSNSYSSLYNSSNTITGLASGMDTEAMIENLVSAYQTKISTFQQDQTTLEWKQEAMRAITDQMIDMTSAFTSYTSATNLSSSGFFTKNVTTSTEGTHAGKVSASGQSSSNIQINSVTQLASSARYSIGADALNFQNAVNLTSAVIAPDPSATKTVSTVSGSLTLTLGTSKYTLEFGTDEIYEDSAAFLRSINEKLKDQDVKVEAKLEGDQIKFTSTADNGDSVYLSGASGKIRETLGVQYASSSAASNRFSYDSITVGDRGLTEEKTMAEYLSGKTIEVTLDGVTKSVSIGTLAEDGGSLADQIAANLTANLNKAFGSGAVTVSAEDGRLTFGVREKSGSGLMIKSDVKELGMDSLSNYFNTSKTIGSLLGDDFFKVASKHSVGEEGVSALEGITDNDGKQVYAYTDGDGNEYRFNEDGFEVDENNKVVYEEKDLVINGVTIGSYGRDKALDSVMNAIRSNVDVGVSVSYSKLTDQFVFSTNNTGSGQSLKFGDGLASRLFGGGAATQRSLKDVFGEDFFDADGNATIRYGKGGLELGSFTKDSTLQDLMDVLAEKGTKMQVAFDEANNAFTLTNAGSTSYFYSAANPESKFAAGSVFTGGAGSYTSGKDAVVEAVVNGTKLELTRSSNVIEMDGMSVTLKGTFETGADEDEVSFKTTSNADAIISTVKTFVDQFNSVLKSVRTAYTEQPQLNSSNQRYKPLTDDDKADMSDSAIAKYEEKAKAGLLFADSDLSQLYTKLTSMIGASDLNLASIGLNVGYSDGITQITVNEEKMRSVLDSDPDAVKNTFTRTKEYGAASDGLMARMKSVFNAYASTSIGSQGILVRKAGTKKSALSLRSNNLQSQIDNLTRQIESWQTKLSNKVDSYTKQFTKLEKLMSSYNNQSSMLADLTGGY